MQSPAKEQDKHAWNTSCGSIDRASQQEVDAEGSRTGAQKGAKEGEEVPPGEEVTGEQDPVDPTPGTSTAPAGSAVTGPLVLSHI